MKSSQVNACIDPWGRKGALYIVAHARWQHSRRRKPSESYRGERNPLKALKLALVELRTFDPLAGSYVSSNIAEMLTIAKLAKQEITGKLNGVTIMVRSDSDPKLIYRDWSRALNGYIPKSVGPYPNPILTDKEKERDDRIEKKNERRRQKEQAKYTAKIKTKKEGVEAKLIVAPDIELADVEGWQKFKEGNSGGYNGAVMIYSERWARLMQVEMVNGKKLAEVADATSKEADLEGITGFMYGMAVAKLAKYWKHGDELRRWHNIETQSGNEGEKANESGGTINPALLSLSIG